MLENKGGVATVLVDECYDADRDWVRDLLCTCKQIQGNQKLQAYSTYMQRSIKPVRIPDESTTPADSDYLLYLLWR